MNLIMKKVLKFFTIGIVSFLLFIFLIIIFLTATPKPSVRSLEKECGVRFPSFSIVEKGTSVGSGSNYYYTVKFKKLPDETVFNRIGYLCKYGPKYEDQITGEIINPWTGNGTTFSFSLMDLDDHAGFKLPFMVRWMDIKLSKNSDLMYITYYAD